MAAIIPSAASSPTSLQLRLAMNRCNFRWKSSGRHSFLALALALARPGSSNCRLRQGLSDGRRVTALSASSSPDGFAGWSDADGGDRAEEEEKRWLEGAVGAGVAGMLLFAGLAFAAFSFSKRSTLKPEPVMESLTAQQEVLLATDGRDYTSEEPNESKESKVKKDDSISETEVSGVTVVPASTESDKLPAADDTGGGNDPSAVENSEQRVNQTGTGDDGYVQEIDVQPNLPVESNASDITPSSSEPISEISNGNLQNPENEQHSVTVEPLDHLDKADLETEGKPDLSSDHPASESDEPLSAPIPVSSPSETVPDTTILLEEHNKSINSSSSQKVLDLKEIPESSSLKVNGTEPSGKSESTTTLLFANEQEIFATNEEKEDRSDSGPSVHASIFSSSGIPAPSIVPPALKVHPGKVLVPAALDQFQGQALTALQTLKVIEADVLATDICSRREYARWLVAASSALSRNTLSKVYPAMYIENITELAFDDILPNDPDFPSIQGLAEAGLISSKLSSHDLLSSSDTNQDGSLFDPESPLSRQDLVSWKMAVERRQLPEADRKILYQLSGFRDVDRIHPDAWPALVADLTAGDQGIISFAFGCTRLFQPDKPVTKAQAAVALATGESADIVGEELTRIEAESVAENAVATHNTLVAQVEREINARFEKELLLERKKTSAVAKMVEETVSELEKLKSEREQNSIALMKERAGIDSEMEVLSKLRREVEVQLESLLSSKVEISYEKERISKLQKEAESEKEEISRLQHELEVERKALSMARAWAEDEAKKAREHAKALEEARDRWQRHGIKVVVDDELSEESAAAVTWATSAKQISIDETVNRAQNLVDKLKLMAHQVRGKSKEVINIVVQKVLSFVSLLKEWALKARTEAGGIKDKAIVMVEGSLQDLQLAVTRINSGVQEKVRGSIQELQRSTHESVQELQRSTHDFNFAVKGGTKRLVDDWRDGVGKLTQKFKS